jgi:hypothetical protein
VIAQRRIDASDVGSGVRRFALVLLRLRDGPDPIGSARRPAIRPQSAHLTRPFQSERCLECLPSSASTDGGRLKQVRFLAWPGSAAGYFLTTSKPFA